ncbi:MAG: T9SS type A sorting domain-containing protein [Cytophagaceae bacterium]|jgi:hypothetical protein|nr:T9SS type A sorting domain-containing protein [Cytophagaceae bacterium]
MKARYFLLGLSLTIACFTTSQAQVNAYAKVQSIAGAILQVTHVHENVGTFEIGQEVILLQMQDGSLSNTSNTSSFGNLGSIQSAGMYEIATISNIVESGGVPQLIELSHTPSLSFHAATSLQLISYPVLGSGNFTTTSALTALPWNGFIGGVVVFQVHGKLFLNHPVHADLAGFRGGNKSGNDGSTCISTTYISQGAAQHGAKGEGIFPGVYGHSTHPYAHGRAPIINGGGGGSSHNSGGGGGGNFLPGENGGDGWNCSSSSFGLGAYDLSAQASTSRLFMGGGGGGGQENNSQGSNGANGGGIVWIKADSIIIQQCLATISAKGGNATNATSDGAGGAGGGGSIILWTQGMRKSNACAYTIDASGGRGGNVISLSAHGGGGGGGGGMVYSPMSAFPPGIQINQSTGPSGLNNLPLSSSLIAFEASLNHPWVFVRWKILEDKDVEQYVCWGSSDGKDWKKIMHSQAKGSEGLQEYSQEFLWESRMAYLRLSIETRYGRSFSEVVSLNSSESNDALPYPNPAESFIKVPTSFIQGRYRISNLNGKELMAAPLLLDEVPVQELPPALYLLEVWSASGEEHKVFTFHKN